MKMLEKWYQLLLKVCRVQSVGSNEKFMTLFLYEQIQSLGLTMQMDAVGNLLVTKGKAKTYPCVVSHMDTVHSIVPNYKLFADKNRTKLYAKDGNTKTGIGGDDKCGIFACLYFLHVLPVVKVIFFTQEETGCVGAKNIAHSIFDDCRYIIELDRRGSSDIIDKYGGNKTVSHQFASEIGILKKKYGFKSAVGSITDCMKLWDEKVGISCVNISAGYYKPHTSAEYIIIDDLRNSIKFVEEMIKTLKPKRYASVPPPTPVSSYTGYTNYKYDEWKYEKVNCKICDKQITKGNGSWDTDKQGYICSICKNRKAYNKSSCTTNHNNEPSIICIACNKKIAKNNSTWVSTEGFYCMDCYTRLNPNDNTEKTCLYCHTKLTGLETKYVNGKTFCKDCYQWGKLEEVKKCEICGKDLGKQYYIRNEIVMCQKCKKLWDENEEDYNSRNLPAWHKCDLCGLYFSIEAEGIVMEDGSYLCGDCKKTVLPDINDDKEHENA